ncbi:serpin B3-like [Heteronotia binoei]|uniref:serpin B3-like n=1 Tax=Heteronotia binoei TaxID=13085 RepID=UPI00292CAAF4|nr:serpin B3-like [Heteronotia binoei]
MTTLPEANAKLATDFYHQMRKEHPFDNLLFSPINLTRCLGLLSYGSRGSTATELEKVLHWDELKGSEKVRNKRYLITRIRTSASPAKCVPDYECENPEGVHTAFSKILADLNKPSTDYFLSFANKLSGDYDVAFIQKFLFCALKLYLTEVGGVDFHNAPEDVRRLINLWVEVRSHGEIKDLLPEHSLDSLTRLLMVNALYFRGVWEIQFNKELTKEAPFYTNEKTSHTVPLMHTRGTYSTGTIHLSNIEVQILEIPYKNREMSMFILLPKDESPESLLQLEDAIVHAKLLDWSHDLKPEDVEVAIPKFSIEKTAEADKYLNLSQISDSENSDFSGATTVRGVAVSQLVHDTFFEVAEEGGDEPAAKEGQASKRQHHDPVHFVADHPFLFYVLHKNTQSIVLFGRFCKPE